LRPAKKRAASQQRGSVSAQLTHVWHRLTGRNAVTVQRIAAPSASKLPVPAAKSQRHMPRIARSPAERWARGEAPTRAALIACLVFLGASAAYAARLGGHLPTVGDATTATLNGAANAAGLGITDVRVIGASRMSGEEVVMRLGIDQTSSLLTFDAEAGRRLLLDVPWVKSASVRKLYPATLEIVMAEREPYALWQRAGQVSLLDRDGRTIGPYDDERFSSLPLVVGEGADRRASEIIELLAANDAVRSRVRAAILVAERRWTLKLSDGVDVKLPELEPGHAIALLARLDREQGILNRDIAALDFRLTDRITVRLTEAASQRRMENIRVRIPGQLPNARPAAQQPPAAAPAHTPAIATPPQRPGRTT
jgi:cell division protein FtsQ